MEGPTRIENASPRETSRPDETAPPLGVRLPRQPRSRASFERMIAAAHDLLVTVLRLLVDELPEKPRRAFLMARLEGLTYRQIARQLSVSESSVKQYLAKAFAHCHARLYDSLAAAPCPR